MVSRDMVFPAPKAGYPASTQEEAQCCSSS